MPETGFIGSPQLQKGALVQVVPGVSGIDTKVVAFQYNPEKMTRSLKPWNPFEADQAQRGSASPSVQPYDPEETFTLTLELDAADGLEDGDSVVEEIGIADRLAALKLLILPAEGSNEELVGAAEATSAGAAAKRPTVPVVLFAWGPGRLLPVRITNLSIDESLFSPTLHPIQAKVSLSLQVLTPDTFRCHPGEAARVATAVYNYQKLQERSWAEDSMANNTDVGRGILPF